MAGADSSVRSSVEAQVDHLCSQGSRFAVRGKYEKASRAYRRALAVAEHNVPRAPLLIARVLNDLGVLLKFAGRFAAAEKAYKRALRLVSHSGSLKEFLATLYHNLAGLEHARVRNKQAALLARRGLALRRTIRPRDPWALVADEVAFAAILADLGRLAAAVRIYKRAIRFYSNHRGPPDNELGAARANLGAVYSKMARFGVAESLLRRAIPVLERSLGKNHPRLASPLNNLAVVCVRQGKVGEADALYKRVLRILAMQKGPTYPSASVVKRNYRKFRAMNQVATPAATQARP